MISPQGFTFTLIISTSMKRYLLSISAALMGLMLIGANGCADEEARKKISELEAKVAAVSDLEMKVEELSAKIADLEAKVAEMAEKAQTKATSAPKASKPAGGAPAGKVK